MNESAFSNGPYWSLGYEVWYYAIFGIAVFARGSLRWIGLALVLAGVGPKLWALFPIWLGGVAVCRWQQSGIPPRAWARAMVAVSILLLSMVKVFQWEQILNLFAAGIMDATVRMPNGFSNLFLGDYLVGGLVMVLIYGLGGAEFVFPSWPRRLIAGLAHLSFGLYLVHVPLLRFFGGLLPGREWLAILLALGCALGFSALCEPQKDRIRRLVDRSLVAREA